jgi:anti-anti-sigma factor
MHHSLNPADHTLSITIPGDLLSTNAEPTRAEFLALLETEAVKTAGWQTLKVDLTAAKMVDSVGLNLIVAIYKEAQKRRAKTIVVISNPNIQRTFLFTRLDKHLTVVMKT